MDVNIIGGADGPTAVYIGSSINWPLIIGTIIVIAAGILAFLFLKKRKK
ncbi:MAG: sodium ion-translocating decarboxylase subunit beta [Lachnospiraceae bacterium]|jgi:LPXTG-motif cell wall-anchored protein|nr:sodium ion-translocating decarboxylase subunit beta [Lachnospiraceae bacterium]